VKPLDLRNTLSWTNRTNEKLPSAILNECNGLGFDNYPVKSLTRENR